MVAALFPRLSAAKFGRRHAAVRTPMAEHGLDAIVAYGNSGISHHNHADIHYLSGFLGNRNNHVVQLQQGDPVLYVQSRNHVPNAREASSIATEWGGADSALTVARHIIETGARNGTLGYVGEAPVQACLAWQRELNGWRFTDVTGPFRRLRMVKSAEEIEWLRRGDVVNIEVSVSYWGCSGHAHRTILVQTEPTELYRRLWECSIEAYHRGMGKLRAGVQLGNLLRITRDGAECQHRLPLIYFVTA